MMLEMADIILAFCVTLATFGLLVLVMLKKERHARQNPDGKCACARSDCQHGHPKSGNAPVFVKPPEAEANR